MEAFWRRFAAFLVQKGLKAPENGSKSASSRYLSVNYVFCIMFILCDLYWIEDRKSDFMKVGGGVTTISAGFLLDLAGFLLDLTTAGGEDAASTAGQEAGATSRSCRSRY
jgi:hypothetical protein